MILINYAKAPHGFDGDDENPETNKIIGQIIDFMQVNFGLA